MTDTPSREARELLAEVRHCLSDLQDMKQRGVNSLDAHGYSRDALLDFMGKIEQQLLSRPTPQHGGEEVERVREAVHAVYTRHRDCKVTTELYDDIARAAIAALSTPPRHEAVEALRCIAVDLGKNARPYSLADEMRKVAEKALGPTPPRHGEEARDAVIEECARAVRAVACQRREKQHGNLGGRRCLDEAAGAELAAKAIESLKHRPGNEGERESGFNAEAATEMAWTAYERGYRDGTADCEGQGENDPSFVDRDALNDGWQNFWHPSRLRALTPSPSGESK